MKNIILCLVAILLTACATHHPRMMYTSNSYANNASVSDQEGILNALRVAVKKQHNMDVNLKVHYLKIRNNWAYIETTGGGDPSINAVMKKVNGKWMLAHRVKPCTPVCPDGSSSCADGEMICKYSLHEQFPHAPMSIFPAPSAHVMAFNP